MKAGPKEKATAANATEALAKAAPPSRTNPPNVGPHLSSKKRTGMRKVDKRKRKNNVEDTV